MDFSQRTPSRPAHVSEQPSASAPKSKKRRGWGNLRVISVILLYSLTVLIVALAIYAFILGNRSTNSGAAKYVATGQYQAVFLNGGQVYFGKISATNSKYMIVNDIYYLRVNQQVQPGQQASQNDISLVKLGCELHGPQDQMVINQEQVVFWENLKTDGQVAKAIKQFQDQNPDGLKCDQPAPTNTNTQKK